MNPSLTPWSIQAAIAFLAVAVLAATQARAIRGAQRHRIAQLCRNAGHPARYEEILAASETIAFLCASIVVCASVIATLLVARWMAGIFDSLSASGAVSTHFGWLLAVWISLVIAPMLMTRLAGAEIVVNGWPLWRPVVLIVTPLVHLLGRLSGAIGGVFGRRSEGTVDAGQQELRLVVDEAHREGHLGEVTRNMIEGIMDLDQVRVADIMTVRTDMISLPRSMPWEQVLVTVAESGHTRIPVWGRTSDDIIGILHSRELLVALSKPGTQPSADLASLLRPPYFVPESKTVQKLLLEFQRTQTHMAVVTNEFGSVSGIVTIEDALEEIVGEIADEHDEAHADDIQVLSADLCEARARVRIADLNARMGFHLPEEADYETIGGLVFHQSGKIPHNGAEIISHGVTIRVLAATVRHIDKVRIERIPRSDNGP